MPMYVTSEPNGEPAIQYKGYRIELSRVGKGWRASIFMPNASRSMTESPFNLEKSDKNEIVIAAKRVIDAHIGGKT